MPYHWKNNNVKLCGVDDMVLLQRNNENEIVENLKKRYLEDCIYTYIGPVLISVNPFKSLPLYSDSYIHQYQGAATYENPPHLFALSDNMYRNMLIDIENQCVIISGESGAGKTVAAKHIMNYVAKVSGGGKTVQHIKEIILESNPLLEAFGNAKTVRNNNSSRFGKYVQIQFSRGGEPAGGSISSFLLEKSRIVSQNEGERSFHIFYQLISGADRHLKDNLDLTTPDCFFYLKQSGTYRVDQVDDAKEFEATNRAMGVMGLSEEVQNSVMSLVAAVLHLGNICFEEKSNITAIKNHQYLKFPACLLGISVDQLESKLKSRQMDSIWGGQYENITVTLNPQQAAHTRDALSKAIYAQLFEYLITAVNKAMCSELKDINIGILDIYGFEIFQHNGFEQFCINYVNEKLQQVFIELTLKTEQEEYIVEGIEWAHIDYFNNKVVCDLIESRSPPGIMSIMDDVCATMHGVCSGADEQLLTKLNNALGSHHHYQFMLHGFIVHHYAGKVSYLVDGFTEKNRDVLYPDLILLMKSSSIKFVADLFFDNIDNNAKDMMNSRPNTFGSKIKGQAASLLGFLMKSTPHYIRCIKPNETKRARDWEESRVKHQVEYLGLRENIRVRRAGYVFRRDFNKFLQRYSILTKETWPAWIGDSKKGIEHIMQNVKMDIDQYQLGKTKIFIKNPESLFILEELRERKYDSYAQIIQKAFKKWNAAKNNIKMQNEVFGVVGGKKERRKYSINRKLFGDYIGLEHRPGIMALLEKKEMPEFADVVNKYNSRFKVSKEDLILTSKHIYLIGREKAKNSANKGAFVEVIKRKIPLLEIEKICMSTRQDDFFIIFVKNEYSNLLESVFKNEFIVILSRLCKVKINSIFKLHFADKFEFKLKKGILFSGGLKTIIFITGSSDRSQLKVTGNTLTVSTAPGLPKEINPVYDEKMKPAIDRTKPRTHFRPAPSPPPNTSTPLNQNTKFLQQVSQEQKPVMPKEGAHRLAHHVSKQLDQSLEFKETPESGMAGLKRISQNDVTPIGIIKPKPKRKPDINFSKCKCLYTYEANDTDELSFIEGDIIDIIKENASGWSLGKLKGKQGLFPKNYTIKI